MNTHASGRHWERVAEQHLQSRGLETLQRNFTCRMGEIDLVMRDGIVTVFIEVRFRGSGSQVRAMDTIDGTKQLKLSRAAGIFLSRNPGLASNPCRFDVICIEVAQNEPRLEWVRNAFDNALN